MIVWWNSDLIPSTPDSGVCQIQIKMWCLASSFIISHVSLGKKIKIFGIILPTLNNEWAEILLSGLISWLASYSSDFFSPQESKKHYYNKIIIKIKSLEISRSPWFEGWLTNLSVFLPQFYRSQPNTFPTWPCFPQWSSLLCLPCCSCGTSG